MLECSPYLKKTGNKNQKKAFIHTMQKVFRECLYVLLLTAAVAGVYNASADKPLDWIYSPRELAKAELPVTPTQASAQDAAAAIPVEQSEPLAITLDQAFAMYTSGEALFIDAREPAEYEEGHITGSRLLPFEHMDDYLGDVLNDYQDGTPVVCYCSGKECKASLRLGDQLFGLGIRPLYVFFGGWQEWQDAGYPIESGGSQ